MDDDYDEDIGRDIIEAQNRRDYSNYLEKRFGLSLSELEDMGIDPEEFEEGSPYETFAFDVERESIY